ncbi:unnamed protein product, partial [Prorocentrum cordatum]
EAFRPVHPIAFRDRRRVGHGAPLAAAIAGGPRPGRLVRFRRVADRVETRQRTRRGEEDWFQGAPGRPVPAAAWPERQSVGLCVVPAEGHAEPGQGQGEDRPDRGARRTAGGRRRKRRRGPGFQGGRVGAREDQGQHVR